MSTARADVDDGRKRRPLVPEVRDGLARDADVDPGDEPCDPRAGGDDDHVCVEVLERLDARIRPHIHAVEERVPRTVRVDDAGVADLQGRPSVRNRDALELSRQAVLDAALVERGRRRQGGIGGELDEPVQVE